MLHLVALVGVPIRRVIAHGPYQTFERLKLGAYGRLNHSRLALHFLAPHGIHGFVGQGNHMKLVIANLGLWQWYGNSLGVRCALVHADVFDVSRVAAVLNQIGPELKPCRGCGRPSSTADAWPTARAPGRRTRVRAGLWFVDANDAHAGHRFLGTRRRDVVVDSRPHRLAVASNCTAALATGTLWRKHIARASTGQCKTAFRTDPWHLV